MASVKTLSAVAVVIIIVAAAAAVVLVTNDGGNDDNTSALGVKALEVGDYYTIVEYEEATTLGADQTLIETKTEITDIAGDGTLTVDVTTTTDGADPVVTTEAMTPDAFVANIQCYIEDTTGLATETLTAADGSAVECWVYVNEMTSGSWTFRTTDYVSKDGYIVYRTVAEATYNGETTTLVKDLQATNLVEEGGSVPDAGGSGASAGGSGASSGTSAGATAGVRTSLAVGDYITYQETDENGRVSTETIEIVGIDGKYVQVVETESDGDVDYERKTASWFTGKILFGSTTWVTYSETVALDLTINGEAVSVECNVYVYEDREDRDTYWVGASDGVLYKAECYDKEDLETESKVLIGTSLFSDAPETSGGSSGDSGTSSGGSSGSADTGTAGTTVAVGDYIIYQETDENGIVTTETIEIVEVNGDMVRVMEVGSDGEVDYEWETASWFAAQLTVDTTYMTYSETETIDLTINGEAVSVECNVYTDEDADDLDTYWVGASDGILYKAEYSDKEDNEKETEVLVGTSLIAAGSGTSSGDSGASSGSSSGTSSGDSGASSGTASATAATNSYGVELAVGDTYTIKETDEDGITETTIYTIVSIDGSRVTVMEVENGRTSHDVTTADDFLDDILVSQRLAASAVQSTGDVNGVSCTVYTVTDGDETTAYYVDSATGLILLVEETEANSIGKETAELTEYNLNFI